MGEDPTSEAGHFAGTAWFSFKQTLVAQCIFASKG
jgi:hypothetical protein